MTKLFLFYYVYLEIIPKLTFYNLISWLTRVSVTCCMSIMISFTLQCAQQTNYCDKQPLETKTKMVSQTIWSVTKKTTNTYLLNYRFVCPFVFFSFGYCAACPPSIYGFWLPLYYHQTLLVNLYLEHIGV
jgi:hypothetical protein